MVAMRYLALIFFVIILFGIIMITARLDEAERWEQMRIEEENNLRERLLEEHIKMEFEPDPDRWNRLKYESLEKEAEFFVPAYKIVFCLKFWQVYAICALQIFYPLFVIITYKNYGMWTISADLFLMSAGALGLLLNGLMRFIWPNLLRSTGSFRLVDLGVLVFQIALNICLPLSRFS